MKLPTFALCQILAQALEEAVHILERNAFWDVQRAQEQVIRVVKIISVIGLVRSRSDVPGSDDHPGYGWVRDELVVHLVGLLECV